MMVIQNPLEGMNLTAAQVDQIEAYYATEIERAKTENITMRVTPHAKNEIKRAAAANGYPKYQKWMFKVLFNAVAQTFPDRYADTGDDF